MELKLENFKKINLIGGTSNISFTKNGTNFSRNAIYKLERSRYVNILINRKTKMLAIKICPENDEDAVLFVKDFKNPAVRWNNKDFLKQIEELMKWNILNSTNVYDIKGEYIEEEQAILFDLTKATIRKPFKKKKVKE